MAHWRHPEEWGKGEAVVCIAPFNHDGDDDHHDDGDGDGDGGDHGNKDFDGDDIHPRSVASFNVVVLPWNWRMLWTDLYSFLFPCLVISNTSL